MKKDIFEADFLKEMVKVIHDMWLKGWDERNGGNVSYRIKNEEAEEYIQETENTDYTDLNFEVPNLANEYFLVTGSGKFFRNVILDPEDTLGIIKINENGTKYRKVWGYKNGGVPTSELPTHLSAHSVKKSLYGDKSRVVMHNHATNLISLTYVLDLNTETFSKELWKMSTECLVVFPEGIGVIPWVVPGTVEIGNKTMEKMKDFNLVIWPFHGIFGTGATLDEAFGLIDTAEKAAEILVKVISMGGRKQEITDRELADLAESFGVTPRKGILKL